jgi:hypothetical protein
MTRRDFIRLLVGAITFNLMIVVVHDDGSRTFGTSHRTHCIRDLQTDVSTTGVCHGA